MSQREVIHAPELTGRGWINTDQPLSLGALRGKVVLLDFWTFCCINCLHVLEELRVLEERFADELVVIGVHSPKFPHEQDPEALRRAVARYGVTHPVLDDPEMSTWRRYGVRAWPTVVLIDPRGYVVGATSGEGVGEAIGRAIEEVIVDAELTLALKRGPLDLVRPPPAPPGPLAFPGKVVVDAAGERVAVSDTGHHRVVVIDASGRVLSVIGRGDRRLADGRFDSACFADPQGMLFDGDVLWVADTGNHALRRIDLAVGTVETVAGTGRQARERMTGGLGRATALNSPWDLAAYGGAIAIAMAGPHQLWAYDPATGHVGVLVGNGAEALVDGPARMASLAQPSGLAAAPGGRLWFVDSEASALRFVEAREDHLEVETAVGRGLFDWGDEDGPGGQASFQHPLGVVVLPDERVLVCDTYNSRLRIFDPLTRVVSTVPVEAGVLDEPSGAATLPDGRVLVCDTNHHRLLTVEVEMGRVERFDITGLAPPDYETALAELDPVSVAPGGVVTLLLRPRLGEGEKLDASQGPPLQLTVSGHAPASGAGPTLTLDVEAAERELEVEYLVTTCGEGPGAVCRLERGRLAIPVRIDSAAPSTAEVAFG